jgi:catechol 2,3-dioxygenase-like lactoylglutathione lyase family enzyme
MFVKNYHTTFAKTPAAFKLRVEATKGVHMLDHITFGVWDFDRSTAFYDQAFAPLGVTRLVTVDPLHTNGVKVTGYGDDRPWFWLAQEDTTRGKLHIALTAADRGAVDAFHAAALAAGGTDNGPPGLRPQYHADYYGAFVLDPDGHNIEAVCHTPAP